MIELLHKHEGQGDGQGNGAGSTFRLRPNRSASPAQLVACFSAIGAVAMAVAAFAASQGNVYAPAFAVLDVGFVGASFWLVTRGLKREETIALSPEHVIVRRSPGPFEARFHPYWVKLEAKPGRTRNEPVRVVLGSHGRSVEVGGFLAEEERLELRDRLLEALAAIRAGETPSVHRAGGIEFEP